MKVKELMKRLEAINPDKIVCLDIDNVLFDFTGILAHNNDNKVQLYVTNFDEEIEDQNDQ